MPPRQRKVQPTVTPERVAAAEEQIIEQTRRIDFYISEYSVALLAQKMRNGDFFVPCQRQLKSDPLPASEC